ncbi:MAG: MFS transporter [Sarcina sp.]
MKKQKNWTAIIFIFLIMAMIAVVDNTKGIFVPAFKREFGVDDNSISNMFIISSAAYMLFSYIGGILSEKLGQKKVYILGILLNIISLFLLAASKTFIMLLIGVGLSSGGIALVAIASNTIIPIIVITAQAVIMNMMHFCFAMGSSLGQVIFGNLSVIGISWRKIYFYVAIVFIVLLIAFIFLKIPVTHITEVKKKENNNYKIIFKNPIIIVYMFAIGFYCFAENGIASWFVNYITSGFNINEGVAANYTAVFFAIFAIGRLFGGFVVRKVGYFNTIVTSLTIAGILLFIGIWLGQDGLAVISISGLFFAITFPTTILTLSKVFKGNGVYVTGLVVTANSFIIMILNKIMGILSDYIGAKESFYMIPITIIISAVLMFILYSKTKNILIKEKN